MYLKKLALKYIGPISELVVDFPFTANNLPQPCVFVGENGAGKTILLSHLVDCFYEITNKLFDDILPPKGIVGYKYYKISSHNTIQIDQNYGFCLLSFVDKRNNIIEYFEQIGSVEKGAFQKIYPNFTLQEQPSQKSLKLLSDNINTQDEELASEWKRGAYFYQPAYRFEEPFWKNEPFYSKVEEKLGIMGQLNKEIEILSSMKVNISYLLDLVLDSLTQSSSFDIQRWDLINHILRIIKGRNDIRFGIGPRGGNRVAIVQDIEQGKINLYLPSINNLSLGELILLNLFLNIIRHSDINQINIQDIEGIVLIDEVDTHLHTKLQIDVLPKLVRLFPKIQFIFTSHSPLFLLGMKMEFKENGFVIINLPSGEQTTTEKFSEFGNAYNYFKQTEKYENDLEEAIYNSNSPVLFVEGIYDKKYIVKAAEFLNQQNILEKIEIIDADGFGNLKNIWRLFNNRIGQALKQKVLLLYDCDVGIDEETKGNLIRINIPFIESNPIKKGIENLFPHSLVKRAMNFNSALIDYTPAYTQRIRGDNVTKSEQYEINKDEKGNFCEWVCKNAEKSDFNYFQAIFEILEKL
ncbi:AAA family ATPase [Legionella gresilensis]|uniref:AAA family ATPase n=1 Tax=Legionella gresilensis TaxID=91823 RepID=UPI00104142F4|nr:AAA family ATPase [Legionella gresilensis]